MFSPKGQTIPALGAYNAATVYITSATATEKKLDLNLTIYYGENYTNPVNITYSGVVK